VVQADELEKLRVCGLEIFLNSTDLHFLFSQIQSAKQEKLIFSFFLKRNRGNFFHENLQEALVRNKKYHIRKLQIGILCMKPCNMSGLEISKKY
jgi:hypothetical protein